MFFVVLHVWFYCTNHATWFGTASKLMRPVAFCVLFYCVWLHWQLNEFFFLHSSYLPAVGLCFHNCKSADANFDWVAFLKQKVFVGGGGLFFKSSSEIWMWLLEDDNELKWAFSISIREPTTPPKVRGVKETSHSAGRQQWGIPQDQHCPRLASLSSTLQTLNFVAKKTRNLAQ